MRPYSLTARKLILAITATMFASLAVVTAGAQARILDDNNTKAGVALMPGTRANSLPSGVSGVSPAGWCGDPWLATDLGGPGLPGDGLCYGGGAVIHQNQVFALTWDAPFGGRVQTHWSKTTGYVETFLQDVANGSGSLTSPYAVTPQYRDAGGVAQNSSRWGGGCIDNGANAGLSSCDYDTDSNAPGHDFPASDCVPTTGQTWGDSFISVNAVTVNSVCLTDAKIKDEVSAMVTQGGILGRTQPGHTPLLALMLPAGVETCLDGSRTLCSANANLTPPPPTVSPANATTGRIPAGTYRVETAYVTGSGPYVAQAPSSSQTVFTTDNNSQNSIITIGSPPPAPGATGWYAYVTGSNGQTFWLQGGRNDIGTDLTVGDGSPLTAGTANPVNKVSFCSYHSYATVNGTSVPYVVQPWTAGTACDEPGVPNIPNDPTFEQLEVGVGQRLVSPLSQGQISAITDPFLNGWAALDGSETEDNHVNGYICSPLLRQLDNVTVGSSAQNPYYLQREFNNGGALSLDPATFEGCAPSVALVPQFVVPSAVNQGDVIQFDGSATESTLIVPKAGYQWSFGDGTTATGPSITHSYSEAGTYNVTLRVTDRGGDSDTLTQTVQVLGSNGQPTAPPPTSNPGSGSGGPVLSAHLQLLPQSLKSVLRNGIAVRVRSNRAANGIATVSLTRATAKKAHLKVGRGPTVRIGIGTVASIKNGTVTLRLHLSRSVAKKLAHLKHVTLTVRLSLVASGSKRFAIVAAGRY